MKSVTCPVCQHGVYSEGFVAGERFPCPHCQHEVTVAVEADVPVLRSTRDLLEMQGWSAGLWDNGHLRLSTAKLMSLGEFVVGALDVEAWTRDDLAQLEERQRQFEKAHRLLADAGIKDEFYTLGRTLLDLFIQLRRREK